MSYGVLQEMPGVTEAEYRLVEKNLGPGQPDGLLAHASGPSKDGWRIINVWADEASFRRFQSERLMPAAGKAAQDPGFDPAKAAGFWSMTVTGASSELG